MRPFYRGFLQVIQSHFTDCRIVHHNQSKGHMTSFGPASVALEPKIPIYGRATGTTFLQQPTSHLKGNLFPSIFKSVSFSSAKLGMVYPTVPVRCLTTTGNLEESITEDSSDATTVDVAPRIKFKRLSKTAKHIMQILDKEAVQEVREHREIPDIRPGYIIQLKVEVPENKRRVSMVKGIVIARRNAGLNTTFRLRRMVAGVGVESLFHLYSPNIKEVKVLDKKKVRRAKLYYLRDKMNALNK